MNRVGKGEIYLLILNIVVISFFYFFFSNMLLYEKIFKNNEFAHNLKLVINLTTIIFSIIAGVYLVKRFNILAIGLIACLLMLISALTFVISF
jgi:ATP/ADP translocase